MNFNRQIELTHPSPSDENTPYIAPSKFYEIEISKTKREESKVSMTTTEANNKKAYFARSRRFSSSKSFSPNLCFSLRLYIHTLCIAPKSVCLWRSWVSLIDFFWLREKDCFGGHILGWIFKWFESELSNGVVLGISKFEFGVGYVKFGRLIFYLF